MNRQRETERLRLAGVEIALERRGSGPPLLLLVGEDGAEAELPIVDALARTHEVLIPWAPGYGTAPDSEDVDCVDDIAYLWLDLLDHLGARAATVIGFSLGGWVGAEMAVKSCARIGRLVLVAPYGIKVGGAYDRDIADIYALPREELIARAWHDPAAMPDYEAMDEAALAAIARNRITTARYCWEPLLHDPRLRRRLHRIAAPTLLVWGADDGIVTPAYGRAYAEAIPGARLEVIDAAGHWPHIERPDAFLDAVGAFLQPVAGQRAET